MITPDEARQHIAARQAEKDKLLADTNGHDPYADVPPPPEAGTATAGDDETRMQWRMGQLRIEREARRRLDDEEHPPVAPPPVKSLTQLLGEPDTPIQYRIEVGRDT
jgi:hypothetical protein